MQSIFETAAKNEVIRRIEKLTPTTKGIWGKMDAAQMLTHCANGLLMAMGEINPPKEWIAIVGWLFKSSYSNEKPFPKNVRTISGGSVSDQRNFDVEKERLLQLIEKMHAGGELICTTHPHAFLGKMSPSEWGKGMYKHLDHHLRQFGL
jgi:hypothetical protein